jgi:DnaD/phage-associated family protein
VTKSVFGGFPARAPRTPVPNLFFSRLLPEIEDPTELWLSLLIMYSLGRRRGYPCFVTYNEIIADPLVQMTMRRRQVDEADLRRALEAAVARRTFICLPVAGEEGPEDLIFLNTETDRRAVARIKAGALPLGRTLRPPAPAARPPLPSIYARYEENIGTLSPMIVEELKDAEERYPPEWIEAAFKEAVDLNKRSWRYIQRILERWATEGRPDEEARRGSETAWGGRDDTRGPYGHIVRH